MRADYGRSSTCLSTSTLDRTAAVGHSSQPPLDGYTYGIGHRNPPGGAHGRSASRPEVVGLGGESR
jgi:hypothetical protein